MSNASGRSAAEVHIDIITEDAVPFQPLAAFRAAAVKHVYSVLLFDPSKGLIGTSTADKVEKNYFIYAVLTLDATSELDVQKNIVSLQS